MSADSISHRELAAYASRPRARERAPSPAWRSTWLAVLACATLPACTPVAPPPEPANGVVIETPDGRLRGSVEDGVRRFAGIPYAAPPVDVRRWRAPDPPTPWLGERDATQFRSRCVQPNGGSEDCLYLNVYTPITAERLPVMVWIHGGGFGSGAGSNHDPTPLVTTGNVVVVTLDYRLGILGSLVLPELDEEAGGARSGAFAVLDQQAALRWVRNNIHAFGGDAGNVSILGQGSGATYVCLNMVSPSAAGLFRAAIAQSGCGSPTISYAAARELGVAVAARLGCRRDGRTNLECMRKQRTHDVDSAAALVEGRVAGARMASSPAVGGDVVPQTVAEAFDAGRFNRVPLIAGHTTHEGRLLLSFVRSSGAAPDDSAYRAALRLRVPGVSAERVAAEYALRSFVNGTEALAAILGDRSFVCPSLDAIHGASAHVPVFAYQFDDSAASRLGATHGSELAYLFRPAPTAWLPERPGAPDSAQRSLARAMLAYWTSFARRHRPEARDAPRWPRYRREEPVLLDMVPNAIAPVSAPTVATTHHCEFWESVR